MFPAMMVYLLLVLIRPQDYPALVERFTLPLQPLALILAAGLWLFSPRKRFDAPQYALILCFLAMLMFSHVVNGWYGGALVQLEKFAPVVLAFVVFANGLDNRQRIQTCMAMFAVCAAVLAVHGIEQARTGLGWTGVGLSQGTRIQYVGIFNDPNDLGMLFVTCIPMAFYLRNRGGAMGLRWLFWTVVAAVLIYGIYLTDSRGSLLALLVVFGVYLWQRRGALIAAGLGGAALIGMLLMPSRMQDMDVTEASAQGRVESWYEGLQMFRGHPLVGVGPDMYSDNYHLTAHNSFVLVLAETGIIGFAIWIALIGYCFRMMWAGSRSQGAAFEDMFEEDAADRASAIQEAHRNSGLDARESGIDGRREAEAVVDVNDNWADNNEGQQIALTLLLSLVGFFTAAFFLSRSYIVILYLLTALVVAHYADMRREDPGLPSFELSRDVLLWPMLAVVSVVGLYLLVKILLVMSA